MRLDDVYEYIRNYFLRNFPESYIIFNKYDAYNFGNEYVKIQNVFKDKNLLEVMDGKYDDEIHKYLDNYLKGYFTKTQINDCSALYGYVQMFLKSRGLNKNFSNDIFDHIVKLVVAEVWPLYDSSKLYTAELDSIIIDVHKKVYNIISRQISEKIEQLLDHDVYFIKLRENKLDKNLLKQYVIKSILLNEERLFLEKVSSLVITSDGELSITARNIEKYVDKFIRGDRLDKVDVVESKKEDVKKEQFYYDDKVKYNQNKMKENSVVSEKAPKTILYTKGMRRKIAKTVSPLLIIAVLGTSGFAIKKIGEKIKENSVVSVVDNIYGLTDRGIYDNVDAANRIINFFENMQENDIKNYNYNTLGFYEEYVELSDRIKNDNFKVLTNMEEIFRIVSSFAKEENEEFAYVLGTSQNRYFYIDFVYDRLVSMGCEEINDTKYQDAITRYKYYYFGNQYGVAIEGLKKEEVKLIEDMIDKYIEYSAEYKYSLGQYLNSGRSR